MQARRAILARIAELDKKIQAIARRHETVRLLMTASGVGPITATAVVAAFDDAARFRRSSSVGAYLGLTPRRYESGEVSRNGRVSKRGDGFTRKCLYEAANAIFSRKLGGPRLREWAKSIEERTGPRKAKVALARKLAVTLHAMWRHVAYQYALPGGSNCIGIQTERNLVFSAPVCVPAGTLSEGKIVPICAAMTAHTTSIYPTLNANMRRPERRPRREP